MQSTLIAGQGKTGTTGLYNAVKDAFRSAGAPVNCLFEPKGRTPLLALGRYDPYTPVLAKVMSEQLDDVGVRYEDFDRRVMTVRDPRDVVISRLLFAPLIRRVVTQQPREPLEEFLDAIRAKEADPSSWSVVGLYDLAWRLGLTKVRWHNLANSIETTNQQVRDHGFTVVRYEDFVDGRLDAVSEYLGIEVTNPAATGSAWLSHIPRSMGYGDWRNWFTEADVEHFGTLFADHMRLHGYDPAQRPADEPRLDPATGSEYLERKLTQRRSQMASRFATDWSPDQVTDEDELVLLAQMADDGDAVAGERAALVLLEGRVRSGQVPAAVELARGAARRGSVDAMRLTARLLREEEDDGDAGRATLEARFWEREAGLGGLASALGTVSSATRPRDQQMRRLRRRLDEVEAERQALAASRRYEVGSLIADLAAGPWPARRRAGARLLRLTRAAVDTRR